MRIAVYNLQCTKDKHSNGVKFSNGDCDIPGLRYIFPSAAPQGI
jgi:hypothetical protein